MGILAGSPQDKRWGGTAQEDAKQPKKAEIKPEKPFERLVKKLSINTSTK